MDETPTQPIIEPVKEKEIILTDAQEKLLLETWNKDPLNPPSLKELTIALFGGEFDGRSLQGRAIKRSLMKFNIRARAASDDFNKTASIELSDAHKTYITNNAATNKSVEMARTIFANPTLTPLSAEARAVNEFVKTLDTRVVYSGQDVRDMPTGEYRPPKTMDSVLKRVNEYINFVQSKDALTAQQKKNLDTLIGYLHNQRFIRLMNNFTSEKDRKTCEDAFIRYTYDKNDLTQEEVDQYIELSHHVVQGFAIQRRLEKLQQALESLSDNTPESMKISMGLVEAIGKASNEYHQCLGRQDTLFKNLTSKRSARLDKQMNETASVLNLVQLWTEEETRIGMLKLAELEQKAIAAEVDKLIDMPEIKARIFGLTKNGIKYG